ncbi:DUF5677 domain-containing protein [Hydrogenophaga palleronii]|uniref:DUF5677 domain-containing protein n=1 Tax=Hydrogenophaga palleronii TaxID=65655 RepID=UPI000A835C8D|nr:DUF5677 domain-containing protein [Hydrogenophaga palleronii]
MPKKRPHAATEFHHAYLEAVRSQTGSAHLLARILNKKLLEQGIDSSKHFDAIKDAAEQLLAAPSGAESSSFDLVLDDEITAGRSVNIHLNSADVEQIAKELSSAIETAANDLFESLSASALQSVLKDSEVRLLHLTNERDAFIRRLELTWAEPLKLLEIQVALCQEIGEVRNDWLRRQRRKSKDIAVVDVVTRLQGRAVQVAGEVQALLRNGFADGAMSRWRTMHELMVTAMLIAKRGPAVAERYVAHVDADSIKAARQYTRFAATLQHRPISARDQKRQDALAADLERKYGKPFLNDYGWAADTLNNPNPSFASIEAAVDFSRLRPYFKLASNSVHAGAKGTFFRLGILGDQNCILVGASNVGLQEAGRLAALSLTQITMVLLLIHPNTDSIIWSRVLGELSLKVEQQFVKVQRRIERKERQLRKEKA